MLDEVTVTATRLPELVLDVPQSVSIVTDASIVERESRTTPEALQEEVGILVQETNLGGGSPFIRGQTGNRILVLIDGIRLNNSTFRFGPNQYLNTVDSQRVERLEVVRGPSSVLYGSDALGGVINVITKRRTEFPQPFGINARLFTQFSSAAVERTGRFESGWNKGALGFQGGATARDFGDLRAGSPTGVQDHTGYHELDGDARLQYRLAPDHELAFAFDRVTQHDVPNTIAFEFDNESLFFDPQQRTLYALEHTLGTLPWGFERWHTSVSFHEQREIRRRRKFDSLDKRREEDSVGTVGATTTLERPVLRVHRLTAGLELYHDEVDSRAAVTNTQTGAQTPARGGFPDGSQYETFGAFVQGATAIGDVLARLGAPRLPLSLIVGGRYSRFAIDSNVEGFGRVAPDFDDLTGSAAATYTVRDGVVVVASVSQGFRAPNLDDTVVLRAVPEQGGVDVPNPTIEPERVTNHEAGLKIDLPVGAGTLYYYYSAYTDLIERREIGEIAGVTQFQRQNVGKAVVQGVEGDLLVPLAASLYFRGNFSWIRGNNTTEDEPFSRIPPVLGLAGLRHQSRRWPVWVELYARVAGAQARLSERDQSDRRIPDGGTPGWHTLNLRSGWQPFPQLEVNLALENLADEQYRIHGSGIDSPGLNAVGNVTWRF